MTTSSRSVRLTTARARHAVFWSALGVALAGAALMFSAVAAQESALVIPGSIMVPVGAFVAAFIGAPMWGEGARF